MRRLFLLLAGLVLAGCASGVAERQEELMQWVGKPESQLLGAFGAPNRSYQANGMTFLTYVERRVDVVADAPYGWYGPGPWWGLYPPPATTFYRECDTTFIVVQGVVRSFSLRGNACG